MTDSITFRDLRIESIASHIALDEARDRWRRHELDDEFCACEYVSVDQVDARGCGIHGGASTDQEAAEMVAYYADEWPERKPAASETGKRQIVELR